VRLSVVPRDAWFARAGHEASSRREAETLRTAAAAELASQPSTTQRRAKITLGGNLVRAAASIARDAEREHVRWIESAFASEPARATAFGAVASALGIGCLATVDAFVYGAAAAMVAAAVRLGLVGPLEGQAVLRRALTAGRAGGRDEGGETGWRSFSPLLDVAAMRHEQLEPRLFAS
jgi:urease accessory protein